MEIGIVWKDHCNGDNAQVQRKFLHTLQREALLYGRHGGAMVSAAPHSKKVLGLNLLANWDLFLQSLYVLMFLKTWPFTFRCYVLM